MIYGIPQVGEYQQIILLDNDSMQQLQHENSQSEAPKSLVTRIPVKEREKFSSIKVTTYKKPERRISLKGVKLDLEIYVYWFLSKYEQSNIHRK